MPLPPFNQDGLLPQGDYILTFDELRTSMLVKPSLATAGQWDEQWRLTLVNNAELLVKELWQVGIKNVFLDGSFVEDKDHPNDIDGYFECDPRLLATVPSKGPKRNQYFQDLDLGSASQAAVR